FVHDMANGVMNPFHGVRSAKDEEQHAGELAILFLRKIFQDVLANQLLRRAMARIGFRHDCFGVPLRQFRARCKHASSDDIESRARNQPANDAAGARFTHRVRRDDGVGKLFSLHVFYLSGGLSAPQNSSPSDCRARRPTREAIAIAPWALDGASPSAPATKNQRVTRLELATSTLARQVWR